MQAEFCELSRFLDNLKQRGSIKEQFDLLVEASIEQGEASHLPQPDNSQDDQTAWIKVHAVFAQGKDIPELIRLWIRVATRQAELDADLSKAEETLDLPDHEVSTDMRRAAYQVILENSSDTKLIAVARRMLDELNAVITA